MKLNFNVQLWLSIFNQQNFQGYLVEQYAFILLTLKGRNKSAHDGIQIYSAIFTLQLEFREFKYDIFACEFLVDTSESLHLQK